MTTIVRKSALAVVGAALAATIAANAAQARGDAAERGYERWLAQQQTTTQQWAADSQKQGREAQRAKISDKAFTDAVGATDRSATEWHFPGNRAGGR